MDLLIARMEDPKFKMGPPLRKQSAPLENSNVKTNYKGPLKDNDMKHSILKQQSPEVDPLLEEVEPSSPHSLRNSKFNEDFEKHKVDFENFRIRYLDPEYIHSNNNMIKRSTLPLDSHEQVEVNRIPASSSLENAPIITPERVLPWRLPSNSSTKPKSPLLWGNRALPLRPVQDHSIGIVQEGGMELDPSVFESKEPASLIFQERGMSCFPELNTYPSPTTNGKEISRFPKSIKSISTPPIVDNKNKRKYSLPNIDTDTTSPQSMRTPVSLERSPRSRARSTTSPPPPSVRMHRRASMIPELEREKQKSPLQEQMRRRKSMLPEVKTVENNNSQNINKFKTFDFKSFQFPLSEPGEIIEEQEDDDNDNDSKFNNIPRNSDALKVKEEKVKRNNGRNKVRTIQDDNDYDDVCGDSHVKNIFTELIQQEKEREKEREKHHHHFHHDVADYTSANTGTFSDIMFDWNEKNSKLQSQSQENSGSGSGSYSSLSMVAGNTSRNETITSREATGDTNMASFTPSTSALGSLHQKSTITTRSNIDGKTTHRHHKSSSMDSKGASFVNDKKRLVYQFLQSMEPPSKNQLQRQGFLFTCESPLISSPSIVKSSTPLGNGVKVSSNKSLQSLLFHDLEHPESLTRAKLSSPYSKPSPSLSSRSNSSSSSSSSGSSSDSSYSDISEESSTNMNDEQMENSLDRYEINYYQQHIALLLTKFDNIMKSHLKDIILKKETNFNKSLQAFDKLVLDLQTLKKSTIDLKTLINGSYMTKLAKVYKEGNDQSFIANLEANVGQNIKKLESFECRMKKCQETLIKEKEELKRMEALLQIEQNIIESKKSVSFFSKYKYVIYDSLSLFLILFIVLAFIYPLKSTVKLKKIEYQK